MVFGSALEEPKDEAPGPSGVLAGPVKGLGVTWSFAAAASIVGRWASRPTGLIV